MLEGRDPDLNVCRVVVTSSCLSSISYSVRTYKNWIKRWKLEKNNKEPEMVAIWRKNTEREAEGKRTAFRVRGQSVTIEQVEHYFQRKKWKGSIQLDDVDTPSDVSCWTPASSPGRDNDAARGEMSEEPREVSPIPLQSA